MACGRREYPDSHDQPGRYSSSKLNVKDNGPDGYDGNGARMVCCMGSNRRARPS